MGVAKNFVVKNGIEVSTDLLFSDVPSNNVGIGTTIPTRKLDVNGNFNVVDDTRIGGIGTVEGKFGVGVDNSALYVDTGTERVGINTTVPDYNLEIIGDVGVSSHLSVGGITTTPILHVTGLTSSVHMNVTGVTTIADVRIEAGFTTVSLVTTNLLSATNANVTGVTTVGGAVTMSSTGIDVNNIDVESLTGRGINITGGITASGTVGANNYTGDGSSLSGIVTTLVAGENISISGGTGTVTVTGLAKTDNINADTLVVTGISTLGIVTNVTSIKATNFYGGSFFGDGSNLSGIDTSGNFSGKTIVCENVLASNPGVGTFGSVVINNPTGRITATEFYGNGANLTNTGASLGSIDATQRLVTTGIATGSRMVSSGTTSTLTYNPTTDTLSCTNFSGDGANLTNTGSTLTAASGSQRVVLTSLTSGTMTSSTTDGDLTFNASTNTLSCTNFSGNGANLTNTGSTLSAASGTERVVLTNLTSGTMTSSSTDGDLTFTASTNTLSCTNFSGSFSGSGASLTSIPNSALDNSTISGVSLGSNLATLTRGSYLTGSNYNGSTARTWAVDATSANTASKVVARDGSGNFSAGTITATLSGTATNANNCRVDADNSTNANHYITFTGGATGNQRLNSDTGLTYNPSSNTITATLNGNASTATNATNAGTLDGYNSSVSSSGSTVVVRDSDGDINGRYIMGSFMNMSHSSSTRNSDTIFYSSVDDYIRKNNASGFRSSLNVPTRTGGNASGTWGISISGNAATATNAGKLDNIDSSQFLRSDTSDQKTSGTLRFNDSIICSFGNSDDCEFFHNGSHQYIDINTGNMYIRDGTTTRFTFDDAGHFTATGDINSNSDVRLKDNIETLEGSLDKVKQLRGVEYDRIDFRMNGDKRYHQLGVIAQEIEKVYPDMVDEDADGMKTVSYQQLVPVLIEAVKELSQEVNNLKNIINK